eukprot:gene16496-25295_t
MNIQSAISNIFLALFALRVLSAVLAVFNNKYIPLTLISLPVAYAIVKVSLEGTPDAASILLVAVGIVFMRGCDDVVSRLVRMRTKWKNALIPHKRLMLQEQARVYRSQQQAQLGKQ